MSNYLLRAITLLALTFTTLTTFAEDWVKESDANTALVLQEQGRFSPESASSLGLEAYDGGVMDLKPEVYGRAMASSRELLATLRERRKTVENPKVLQDLDILIQAVEDTVTSSTLSHDKMLPYYNIPQALYYGFHSLLDPRTDPKRYPAALERLAKYTGPEPITELAEARTEERFAVPGLIGPFKGEVERDLENLPRFLQGMRQLFTDSGLKGWEEAYGTLEKQLNEYGDWVRTEMLPRARTDHRLPPEIYADNLKNFGVRAKPEDLISTAEFGFQEIRAEMKTVARQVAAQRGWENGELMHVMAELKKDQIPPDQVLDIYKQRLASIEDIIREHDIITLPERPANIRLATEAESASIPAPFMSPPQLIGNTGQYGEFVLVQHNPSLQGKAAQMDDWSHQAITWALTVHEARPGHELQFSRLIEDGTSQARAIYAFNSANVEGWGLYAEAIMLEYLPLDGQLFTLMARLQRAARMFLDPMVNLGQMTPDEAVTFMREQVGLSEAMARSEADRYSFLAPGQATAYYYGYMNLQRLRTEVEMKLGDRFKQRKYHDFVLAQGLLPPDLLRQAVLEEFIPAQ